MACACLVAAQTSGALAGRLRGPPGGQCSPNHAELLHANPVRRSVVPSHAGCPDIRAGHIGGSFGRVLTPRVAVWAYSNDWAVVLCRTGGSCDSATGVRVDGRH